MPSPADDPRPLGHAVAGATAPAPAGPSGEARRGAAVSVTGVSQWFGRRGARRHALDDVSLEIEAGEFVCLIGPSGCGKSTLLNLVAGFVAPTTGTVATDGAPVTGPGADRGVVFQQPRLFPWLSVRSNVALGPRLAGMRRADRRRIADEALALVGLSDVADRPPYELSGGMQQRAAIARALGGRPRVLLMDEPFAALDALTRERLQDEILRVWAATGTTVVFVTHSVEEAVYLGTRVVAFSARPGRVIFDELGGFGARTDREDLRSEPDFVTFRDRVHRVIRTAAGG
ncbi:ABC transporter ATP-binding protein [Frankia sp. CN6]|uniref:ABC transporter ATP-binding protein n=1 Tax=Frankia nepalensis TaxID=1836974 RepID=A0A937RPG5_9ACTN|nr:ABC transporter ATP-binding protein [Frankia nepalensis]MBL7629591.1 ABC transporter ATP-binding protein [Frankia nepalensis]